MTDTSLSAEIPVKDLIGVLHAQAHALMLARPDLKPAAALAEVAALAVLVYDAMELEAALRKAAAQQGVSDALARLVHPAGGATSALTTA